LFQKLDEKKWQDGRGGILSRHCLKEGNGIGNRGKGQEGGDRKYISRN